MLKVAVVVPTGIYERGDRDDGRSLMSHGRKKVQKAQKRL